MTDKNEIHAEQLDLFLGIKKIPMSLMRPKGGSNPADVADMTDGPARVLSRGNRGRVQRGD